MKEIILPFVAIILAALGGMAAMYGIGYWNGYCARRRDNTNRANSILERRR
jgi:membrane protein DedA with SNARE-associated domain